MKLSKTKPDDEKAREGLNDALLYCQLEIDRSKIAIEILELGTSGQMRFKVENSYKEQYVERMALNSVEIKRSMTNMQRNYCTSEQVNACEKLGLEQEEPTAEA